MGRGRTLEPAEPAQGWRTLKKPMKQTVSFQDFRDAVRDSYSYEAARALFDYLEEYEEGTGEELELDPVAIRSEYTEYDSAWLAMEAYQPDDMPTVDDSEGMDLVELGEEQEKLAREWLEEQTTVIPVSTGGVVIADF